jgi:outer membrane protein
VRKITFTVGVFTILGFLIGACNPSETEKSMADETADEINFTDLKVAYIYTDSVINNYEFFKEKSAEIAEKGKRYEGELTSRARGFEQEVQNFQSSANNMTINQAKAKEEELVAKERNLVTYRDNVMQELSADETKLYNEVYDKIQDYLKVYAAENDLEMILSYTRGGGVWYADSTLDITQSVVNGINDTYKNPESNTGPAPAPATEEEN